MTRGLVTALRAHWPEYLIEGSGLALFMASAGFWATVLEHPASPVRQAIPQSLVRRAIMGLAIGATALGLVYSRMGKRSGAHFNPALTLTFLGLAKLSRADAALYVGAQFTGAVLGLAAVGVVFRGALADPSVNFVVTAPGADGPWVALGAESLMAFILMGVVLVLSNRPSLNRYTGLAVAALLALFITVEAPMSGMSLNPARSLASALLASVWSGLWIYFVAPLVGMLSAAALYQRKYTAQAVRCAKLHHDNHEPCIFRCDYPTSRTARHA